MEKWFLKNKRGDASALADALQISPVLAKILINRDVNTEELARTYLEGNMQGLHAPELLKDCVKAADIVKKKVIE
ncbi:MAG: single-stranded-DNA-specific exonuclease RecJ, partial [Lachnospiraceae bacterium]|nr:single-stranded-DNA-specific exonuclease RecJ [Lachnospiraceae bacterium]